MTEDPINDELLHKLYKQVSEHLETRWTYFTLTTTEKSSAMAASLAGALVIMVFSILVLFFFSMGFAWWLGDFIGNRAGGFALAGLIFVPIAAVVYRWIGPFVREKIIETVLNDDHTENPNNNG